MFVENTDGIDAQEKSTSGVSVSLPATFVSSALEVYSAGRAQLDVNTSDCIAACELCTTLT